LAFAYNARVPAFQAPWLPLLGKAFLSATSAAISSRRARPWSVKFSTMTTPLWTVLIASFLPYVWATIGRAQRKREFGKIDDNNPRQQQAQQTGTGARAAAASANAFEALAVYAPAVVIAHLQALHSPLPTALSLLWVALRIGHGVCYVTDRAAARGLCFIGGSVCTVGMYVAAACCG
jgi:uncharacterized MAPEG superfamily protein